MSKHKGVSGVGSVHCPIHKTQPLTRVFIRFLKEVSRKTNKYGKVGSVKALNWYYCEKCDKCYKISIKVHTK